MPAAAPPMQLLRQWDSGSRATRVRILQNFIEQCDSLSAPQLERELGNSGSLLLARISSWLRLTYAMGQPVSLQLRAVRLFLSASSGQRFLAEYVEVGGLATLIEIMSLKHVADADKAEALRVLETVVAAGRHYKELVCEASGIPTLRGFMEVARSDELLEPAASVLVALGKGNPRYLDETHEALLELLGCDVTTTQRLIAAGFRGLISCASASPGAAIEPRRTPALLSLPRATPLDRH